MDEEMNEIGDEVKKEEDMEMAKGEITENEKDLLIDCLIKVREGSDDLECAISKADRIDAELGEAKETIEKLRSILITDGKKLLERLEKKEEING